MNPAPLPGPVRQARDGRRLLFALAILGLFLIVAGVLLFRYWKKSEPTEEPSLSRSPGDGTDSST